MDAAIYIYCLARSCDVKLDQVRRRFLSTGVSEAYLRQSRAVLLIQDSRSSSRSSMAPARPQAPQDPPIREFCLYLTKVSYGSSHKRGETLILSSSRPPSHGKPSRIPLRHFYKPTLASTWRICPASTSRGPGALSFDHDGPRRAAARRADFSASQHTRLQCQSTDETQGLSVRKNSFASTRPTFTTLRPLQVK